MILNNGVVVFKHILTGTMGEWNWGLLSLLIIGVLLLIFYSRIEKLRMMPAELALIAALAALAAVGRVPFAFIPSVQPTTFIIVVSGVVFGAWPGFLIGSLATLASNFFLGQGPWTPWQMVAWGLVGMSAGWLGRFGPGRTRWTLTLFGFGWGYLFGWIVDLSYWFTFVYPLTAKTLLATLASSLTFDSMHALANAVLLWLLGPATINLLEEFRHKIAGPVVYEDQELADVESRPPGGERNAREN